MIADLFGHRQLHADKMVDETALIPQPDTVELATPFRLIVAVQVIADFRDDRRTVRAEEELEGDSDHDVGIAGAEKDVGTHFPHDARQCQDHPEGFPAGRWQAETGRCDEAQLCADIRVHVAIGASHEQRRVDAQRAPVHHQPERDALDAAWLEAVQERQDAHAFGSAPNRSP
jgi:hypothetical protein